MKEKMLTVIYIFLAAADKERADNTVIGKERNYAGE